MLATQDINIRDMQKDIKDIKKKLDNKEEKNTMERTKETVMSKDGAPSIRKIMQEEIEKDKAKEIISNFNEETQNQVSINKELSKAAGTPKPSFTNNVNKERKGNFKGEQENDDHDHDHARSPIYNCYWNPDIIVKPYIPLKILTEK